MLIYMFYNRIRIEPFNIGMKKSFLAQYRILIILGSLILLSIPEQIHAQNEAEGSFSIARVQYGGGGDWYSSPTALTNLISFAREEVPIPVRERYEDVRIGSRELFNYPFLFITGHGNISLTNPEMDNLREYLDNGGFLMIDDDYGMDEYVRPLLRRLYPDEELFELPADHPVYNIVYPFPDGRPPKVHEHDGQPPQAFAIYRNGRMVVLYTYESNPSDGWAYDEHSNPESVNRAALQFGVNVLTYVLTNP